MSEYKFPDDLRYSKTDEWYRVEGDTVTVGITDYAQTQLNDIVYVEYRDVGDAIAVGESLGEVESVKASSEIYSLVDGEVAEVNEALPDDPEMMNASPYGDGWLVKLTVEDTSPLTELMDAAAYREYCDSRS